MTRTLPLVERLLLHGRTLHKLGVHTKALRVLARLSKFRNLSEDVTSEIRMRLALIQGKRRKLRQARRHLSAILMQQPDDARYQHLMARLTAVDFHGDPARAAYHYRQALKLDPKNPFYLSAFGIFALRNGKRKIALVALRRAYRLSPDNPTVLRRYIKALQVLHHLTEAREVLLSARFRLGQMGWFQKMHADFQFFVLHHRQKLRQRRQAHLRNDLLCLLPFPELETCAATAEPVPVLRIDGPAVLPAPHMKTASRRPDQRHAQ